MFKAGTPKPPTSGRKKGVPNKATASIKELVTQKLGKELPLAILDLAEGATREFRLECYKVIAPYVMPKLSVDNTINVLGDVNNTVNINQEKVEQLAKELIEVKSLSAEDL